MDEAPGPPARPQKSIFRQLLTGAAQYSVGGLLARALTLVSVPVFLHFLRSDQYGIQSIALLNEQVLVIISGYAITNAVSKYYMEAMRRGEGEGTVVGTAMLGLLVPGLIAGILWQVFAASITRLTLEPSEENVLIVRLVGVSFFASIFFTLATSILQLRQQAIHYSAALILKFTLGTLLGILFVWLFAAGPVGVVLGWTLASLLSGALAVIWMVRGFTLRFRPAVLRALAVYGLPLLPAALLSLVFNGADRYFLKEMAGLNVVGLYAVVGTLAAALNLALVTPFKQVWAPLMWKMRHQSDEVAFHRRTLTYYVAAQVFVLAAAVIFADVAMGVLSGGRPAYVAVALAVPLSYAGYALFGVYNIVSAGYFFEAKTYYYTFTVIASAVTSVVLNVLLIPVLGLWGSALAFALSYLVFAILSYVFGRRFFSVPYEWGRMAKAVVAGVLVGGAGLLARDLGGIAGLGLAALVLAGFPLLLLGTGFFTTAELARARALLAQVRRTRRHVANDEV